MRRIPGLVTYLSRIVITGLLGVAGLIVAGSPNSSITASASTAISTCSYNHLEVAVARGPDAAAGHVGFPLLIANTGKSTCTLKGYPTIEIETAATNRTGYKVSAEVAGGIYRPAQPVLVSIAPGATASFGLDYVDVLNQKDTSGPTCTARYVNVKLPVRNNPNGQLYQTTVNFNLCYSGFAVSVTPIESGPLPKVN